MDKCYRIGKEDPIVDNIQTYEHHYKWANPPHNQHPFKKRRRYTLKAHPDKSFQPQNSDKTLFDILPFLNKKGLKTEQLVKAITSSRGAGPFKLENNLGLELYDFLKYNAPINLTGQQLSYLHPDTKK